VTLSETAPHNIPWHFVLLGEGHHEAHVFAALLAWEALALHHCHAGHRVPDLAHLHDGSLEAQGSFAREEGKVLNMAMLPEEWELVMLIQLGRYVFDKESSAGCSCIVKDFLIFLAGPELVIR